MKRLARLTCTIVASTAAVAAPAAIAIFVATPSLANDITTEWASVRPPAVPQLKPVSIDPKTTALLVLDFMKVNCGARPRCVATVPNVKKLIDEARAHDMTVFYTLVGQDPTPAGMIDQSLVPRPTEFRVQGSGARTSS